MLHYLLQRRRFTPRILLSSGLSTSLGRGYVSRKTPAKKSAAKTTIGSESAPNEDKIKKKTKRVSQLASNEVLEPNTESRNKATTLMVGASFEFRSLKLLQDNFSMALDCVSGPGDGGVDLIGWWWLPRLRGPPEPSRTVTQDVSDGEDSPQMRSRIRMLVQCKAERMKIGPNYVREMEGVLLRLLHSSSTLSCLTEGTPPNNGSNLLRAPDPLRRRPIPAVAMIVSQSRFTKGAVMRAMSSPVPFILLYLPLEGGMVKGAEEGEEVDKGEDTPSLQWNAALGSEKGLLGGSLEVRWQWEAGGHHPRLWWQGQPMKSCVPVE